jgi:hypothetical protein
MPVPCSPVVSIEVQDFICQVPTRQESDSKIAGAGRTFGRRGTEDENLVPEPSSARAELADDTTTATVKTASVVAHRVRR